MGAARTHTDARIRRRRYGMSLVVIHFGTDRGHWRARYWFRTCYG